MKSIFENLENLNVSESCFHSILDIVEEYINELREKTVDNAFDERVQRHNDKMEEIQKKYKSPNGPDDVDTKVNNRDVAGEEAQEIENFGKKLDLYQKWLDKKHEKKNN